MIAGILFVTLVVSSTGFPAKGNNQDYVIWYPIDGYTNGYKSSLGEVFVDPSEARLGRSVIRFGERRGRSPAWNEFDDWRNILAGEAWGRPGRNRERKQESTPIVFPAEEDTTTTTPRPEYANCYNTCPRTREWNPVCGSNGQNYRNKSELKCAQFCGTNVAFRHEGVCNHGLPGIFRPTARPSRAPQTRLGDFW